MADQDYKSLYILWKNTCFPCGSDVSSKSATLIRGDNNHQFNFSIDWDMDSCQYSQRILKNKKVCN